MERFDQFEAVELEDWERTFLEAFVNEFGVESRAAKKAGVHPARVSSRAKESPTFRGLLAAARKLVDDTMEYEIMRRAFEPNERPVFQRGKLVAVMREYDNRHLQWLAERRMPEKYHLPTIVEFAGDRDGAVKFKMELNPADVQEEEDEPADA